MPHMRALRNIPHTHTKTIVLAAYVAVIKTMTKHSLRKKGFVWLKGKPETWVQELNKRQ